MQKDRFDGAEDVGRREIERDQTRIFHDVDHGGHEICLYHLPVKPIPECPLTLGQRKQTVENVAHHSETLVMKLTPEFRIEMVQLVEAGR